MESGDAPSPTTCPHCGCTENKPKYINNKKPNQLRVECHNCNRLFQRNPIRKVHPEGYKKEKVEEPMPYLVLTKECDTCHSTNAKFYSLNNNDPMQPRYKCKNPKCKKVFTPFKKSQQLKQKRAPVNNNNNHNSVMHPTTTSEINSLRTSIHDPRMVNNSGPTSRAPNDTGYCMQATTAPSHTVSVDRMYNSFVGNSAGACGLGQNAQSMYGDPRIHNIGFTTYDPCQDGGGPASYQQQCFHNLPLTQPFHPANNHLLDPRNICANTSTSFPSPSYPANRLFTNVPQTPPVHEHNMQMSSERPYHLLRQPYVNLFSGSMYQAPERVLHEGSAINDADGQLDNLQQPGNHDGPMQQNHQDLPPFNNPPY